MSSAACNGKRALIVEDNLPYANVTSDFLKQEGMETVIVDSTDKTLKAMETSPFHVVLLDIYLGGEDGLAFLPKLKKLYPKVPVVVLTGLGYDTSMIKTAIDNGASTYFSKENDPQDLIGLLERLLGAQGPDHETSVSKAS
jgi:DNA-binding NtrC family response regulator